MVSLDKQNTANTNVESENREERRIFLPGWRMNLQERGYREGSRDFILLD